ncbi:MAG: Hsp20/alpha crystallin family protein [Erysipelotrichaceae bacterium]
MKLIPFRNSLLDDFFDAKFYDSFPTNSVNSMKTDISEKDGNYLLDIELPGYKKEDINVSLKDGYLNVSASTNNTSETKDDEGNIIRRERSRGSVTRSYYLGKDYSQEDISAKYDNGELKITIKAVDQQVIAEKHSIAID